MDKVCQVDAGTDQQSQPGAADSTAEQDWGQPEALQTGWGEQENKKKFLSYPSVMYF